MEIDYGFMATCLRTFCSLIGLALLVSPYSEIERRFRRHAWNKRFDEAKTLDPEVNGQPL